MPTKGKLPTAKELTQYVKRALTELTGEAYYRTIDKLVRVDLEDKVYSKELHREVLGFRGTSLASKTALARRILREKGVLGRSKGRRGYWHLTAMKKNTSNVYNFAEDAVRLLQSRGVSKRAIDEIRKLLLEYQMRVPDAHPDHAKKMMIEKLAIASIRKEEPSWHVPDNPKQPGFDLFQTASGAKDGEKIKWCEVKSLSEEFSRVEMTITEFKKAIACKESYWLYVVENVGGPDENIIKIQNPGGRTERVTFRHSNWR